MLIKRIKKEKHYRVIYSTILFIRDNKNKFSRFNFIKILSYRSYLYIINNRLFLKIRVNKDIYIY